MTNHRSRLPASGRPRWRAALALAALGGAALSAAGQAPGAGESFRTVRAAGAREVLRGVSFTPGTPPALLRPFAG
jgi:hypothetical protein